MRLNRIAAAIVMFVGLLLANVVTQLKNASAVPGFIKAPFFVLAVLLFIWGAWSLWRSLRHKPVYPASDGIEEVEDDDYQEEDES